MFASALTIAVLPAILLVNREQDGVPSPNVAAVGLPAGGAATSVAESAATDDPLGALAPQFLTGTPGTAPPPAAPPPIVVGSAEHVVIGTGTATYSSDVDGGGCLYNGVAMGELIVVVNVDNGRSVECWSGPQLDEEAPADQLVLSPTGFLALADLTDAPVPIEIRQ